MIERRKEEEGRRKEEGGGGTAPKVRTPHKDVGNEEIFLIRGGGSRKEIYISI